MAAEPIPSLCVRRGNEHHVCNCGCAEYERRLEVQRQTLLRDGDAFQELQAHANLVEEQRDTAAAERDALAAEIARRNANRALQNIRQKKNRAERALRRAAAKAEKVAQWGILKGQRDAAEQRIDQARRALNSDFVFPGDEHPATLEAAVDKAAEHHGEHHEAEHLKEINEARAALAKVPGEGS